jgi:hypothetical protein
VSDADEVPEPHTPWVQCTNVAVHSVTGVARVTAEYMWMLI